VSGAGEVDREGGFFSPERLKRYKERLVEATILGLPIALINLVHGKVSGVLTSQPWHVLWFIAPLAGAAWVLWPRLKKAGALHVRGATLLFLVCYLSVFTLAAASDLLVWKRSTVTFDEGELPRNWLLPAGWGDWRYRLVPRSQTLESLLVVVTMEKPAEGATRDALRFELARLIQFAAQSRARGIALDFYFGRESSDVDGFLCQVVDSMNRAGFPVIAGQRIVRGQMGRPYAERYADSIEPCFPDDHRGHLLAYKDADGVIRHVALRLRQIRSTSLSLKVASQLDRDRTLPTGSLLQFVESQDTLPPLEYERLAREPPEELASVLRGHFVLVGERSQSERFQTPFGERLGVEVHAAAIGSLLTGRWIKRPSWWSGLLIIVLACYAIVALAAEGASSRKLLLIALGVSVFLVLASALAMRLWLVWLDVIYALVAVWLLVGLLQILRKSLRMAAESH
jgi:CHASE2 domain-containing sensor protein